MIPFIATYLATGILLAASALTHGIFGRDKRVVAALFTVLFWPVLVFATPEIFFRSQSKNRGADELTVSLAPALTAAREFLTESEAAYARRVAENGQDHVSYFADDERQSDVLNAFWSSDIPPSIYYELAAARRALSEADEYHDDGVRYSLVAPDWFIGFSTEFLKSITGVDKKMQGRILEAVGKISRAPITPHGDSMKPLSNDLSGLWRCRIGDSRLVYFPNAKTKQVTLICFCGRGSVYDSIPNLSELR